MWRKILVLSVTLICKVLYSNASVAEADFSSEMLDSLNLQFGTNKTFDSAMYPPALLALAHYPELANTRIEYRYKKLPTLMAARPAFDFIFRKKSERKYIIYISNNPENHSYQVFRNMSLASKTGILGHEYAHLVEYEKLSNLEMAFYALWYFAKRKKIERETDRAAIERGLGHEMLEYTVHIKTSKLTSQKYLERKKKYYLSVAEIKELLPHKAHSHIVKNY